MKSPAFQFYAADYLADESVQLMTLEEEGIYIRLLAYCWREGSIPADTASLSRLCKGASAETMAQPLGCFISHKRDASRLVHPRLENERKKQENFRQDRRNAGKKGAANRWKMGNGSANGKAMAEPLAEPMAKDGSSSSSSSTASASTEDTPIASAESGAEIAARAPILPTLDQAMGRAPAVGVNPKAAECWWLECEGRGISPNGYFIDAKGAEVRNWQAAMTSYGRKWQSIEEQRAQQRRPGNTLKSAPVHIPGDKRL